MNPYDPPKNDSQQPILQSGRWSIEVTVSYLVSAVLVGFVLVSLAYMHFGQVFF